MYSIEEKINEVTGSIKKEQWRMHKVGEPCSVEHATFLDSVCFTLFDIAESLSHPESTPSLVPPKTKQPEITNVKEEKKTLPTVTPIAPPIKSPIMDEDDLDDDMFPLPTYVEPIDYVEPIKEEDTIPEVIEQEQEEIKKYENASDFTYSYQKFTVKKGGPKGEFHVSTFPLTTSKDENVNVPIVTSVYYNGSKVNLSSLDNSDGYVMLSCDLLDFCIGIRGYIDEKGNFHASITPKTEGYELTCTFSEEHTNAGANIQILSDEWEDKKLYAFPLNLDTEEFLIVAKSEEFNDYYIADENRSSPIIAYENDEENMKKAFIKCQFDEETGTYEFILKELE